MIKNFLKSHSIHKKIAPFFDGVMLSRPTLFFGVWVMVCIGMYIGSIINDGVGNTQMNITTFDYNTSILFLGISLVCASTFILNQISDLKTDQINKKIFIINNVVSKEKALMISKVIGVLGLISVAIIDWAVVFPLLLLYMFWGKLYNEERFNWKADPWLGLVCNVICGYLLILSGLIYKTSLSIYFENLVSCTIYIIPFLLAYSSIVLLANIPDKDGDESIDKKTFTVIFGIRNTIMLSTLLCLLSFIVGMYIGEPLSSTSALSALPFFFFSIFRGKNKDIIRSIRYPILLLNFYVLTIYPLLFFPVMISYYITKYYYWHRFSIHYPTLLVDND